ncbi:MAG: hypothetical protein SCALA702_31870 [Melioribacteraceae bacterium]|nr:MAG: hypothetical protein SCALA702_31870 [Melioribacteraceae bacterium]
MIPDDLLDVNVDEKFKIVPQQVNSIVEELQKELKFSIGSVSINFLDENFILELNREHLNHDYNTDIITFNYSGENDNLDGEIYISVDDAKKNAYFYNVSHEQEILRLIIHGFLHLLGYDDVTAEEKKVQKKLEDHLVYKYSYLTNNLCANDD